MSSGRMVPTAARHRGGSRKSAARHDVSARHDPSVETVAEVPAPTCAGPPGGGTRRTGRAVIRAVGIPLRAVQRIRIARRRQLHRVRRFTGSRDPFAATVDDVARPSRPRPLTRWCYPARRETDPGAGADPP